MLTGPPISERLRRLTASPGWQGLRRLTASPGGLAALGPARGNAVREQLPAVAGERSGLSIFAKKKAQGKRAIGSTFAPC